ncbi:MAG: hypothetical protein HYY85_13880 [Deltaproteobacteria bacterium]|nr:hypothetical protein [Deltaproteobacteria bacterium]
MVVVVRELELQGGVPLEEAEGERMAVDLEAPRGGQLYEPAPLGHRLLVRCVGSCGSGQQHQQSQPCDHPVSFQPTPHGPSPADRALLDQRAQFGKIVLVP